jgi:hypothetical protein
MGLGKNLTKLLAVGVPVTLALVLGLLLYAMFRMTTHTSLKDVEHAAMLATPEGRLAAPLLAKS